MTLAATKPLGRLPLGHFGCFPNLNEVVPHAIVQHRPVRVRITLSAVRAWLAIACDSLWLPLAGSYCGYRLNGSCLHQWVIRVNPPLQGAKQKTAKCAPWKNGKGWQSVPLRLEYAYLWGP